MAFEQPISVAFSGVSGSGKGTQAKLLQEYLEVHDPGRKVLRPEMGVLFRTFIEEKTPLAERTRHIHDTRGLAPSFMPIYLLTHFMNKEFSGQEHVIFDGTCRRPDQSRAVNDMVRLWERTELYGLVIDLSSESVQKRLKLRGRQDDSDNAIQNRVAYYKEHVVPAYQELERLGWNVLHVDGEPDTHTIHKNILSVLGLTE